MLKEQFKDVLAEFGGIVKQELSLDDDGTVTFTVDDEIVVSLQYLDERRLARRMAGGPDRCRPRRPRPFRQRIPH